LGHVASPGDDASVVLAVDGTALKQAVFYFENTLLKTIPLDTNGSGFPEKSSDARSLIVLQTTRRLVGWEDASIYDEYAAMINKGIDKADGNFYFEVIDQFGRSTRFDIAYKSWRRTDDCLVLTDKNNFWDPNSNGTNVTARNEWTRLASHILGNDPSKCHF
jgi:hypothetical protein